MPFLERAQSRSTLVARRVAPGLARPGQPPCQPHGRRQRESCRPAESEGAETSPHFRNHTPLLHPVFGPTVRAKVGRGLTV